MVSTRLVGAHQELHFKMVRHIWTLACRKPSTRHCMWDTTLRSWYYGWWGLKSLRHGHFSVFHISKVDLPGEMNTWWVLLPLHIHLIYIVRSIALQKGVIRVLSILSQLYVFPCYFHKQDCLPRLCSSPLQPQHSNGFASAVIAQETSTSVLNVLRRPAKSR